MKSIKWIPQFIFLKFQILQDNYKNIIKLVFKNFSLILNETTVFLSSTIFVSSKAVLLS